jgi:cysteine desulfurase family protein (TIGR01976 family)
MRRSDFPALAGGAAFFDGPGGTQVPEVVIAAMARYLRESNANTHGAFPTSAATDAAILAARQAVSDLLGAEGPQTIAFGANMTTLCYSRAWALGRDLGPGDEIVAAEVNHEAHIGPWEAVAAARGATLRLARLRRDTCTVDAADLPLGPRTRVVAVTWASNVTGAVLDAAAVCRAAHDVGAVVVLDAVHYVPHFPVHVQAIGCDFLLTSAYKWFGPHVGALYGRPAAWADLAPYRPLPQGDAAPEKFETGTLNHEGLAGVTAAVDWIASLSPPGPPRRVRLRSAMEAVARHEETLAERLRAGLAALPVRVFTPAGPRTPTVSFLPRRGTPEAVAAALGRRGIYVWHGDFFATRCVRALGGESLVRVGMAPYNTAEEVERLLAALGEVLGG